MFALRHLEWQFLILGLILVLAGLSYKVPLISQIDGALSSSLHLKFKRFLPLFRLFWICGKTPILLFLLILLFLTAADKAYRVSLCYLMIALGERLVKLNLQRQRPFKVVPRVAMYQPHEPLDPSHPSGDAMRIWFLAMVLPQLWSWPWWVFVASCLTALVVSLGRIAFGVHFLLDVLSGAGLGLVGAGLYLLMT